MMRKTNTWNRLLSLVLCLCMVLSLVPMVMPEVAEAVAVPAYIREIYFAADSSKSDAQNAVRNAGFTLIDYDLNKGCGAASDYIYMGYKTTSDPSQAITGIFFSDDVKNPPSSYTFTDDNGNSITAYKASDVDLNKGCGIASDYIYAYTTTDRRYGNPIFQIQIKGNNSINGAESDGTWTIGRQINSGTLFGTDGRNLNAATVGDNIYLHYKQFRGEVTANYWYLDGNGNRQKYVMTKTVGDHLQRVELDKTDFPDSVPYNNWTYVRSVLGSTDPVWREDTQPIWEPSGTTSVNMMDSGKNMYAVYVSNVQFGFGEYDAVYTYTDFKIIFNANGGSGTMYPDYASQTINTGSSAITKSGGRYQITDRNMPVYSSKCAFLGWSTDKNAKTAQYKIGDTLVTESRETTLYAVWKDHVGVEDSICNDCGKSLSSASQSNGVYQITNKAELIWFQQYVNQGNKSANAILVNDIDMGGYLWTPIASTGLYYNGEGSDKGYAGTFDGNGKCISNFKITTSSTEEKTYGLFGTLSGTVKNLGIDNVTYSFPSDAKDLRAGGIVGQMISGSMVENCYVINSSIAPGQYIVGGIAACSYGGSIKSCYTYQVTVSGNARCGNLVSDTKNDKGELESCAYVDNCYTDADRVSGTQSGFVITNEASVSAERFASGEITYKLNGSSASGAWKQTLETHSLPGFNGSAVYQVYKCDRKTITYSNDPTNPQTNHTYVDNICTCCGGYRDGTLAKVTKKGVVFGAYTTLNDAFKAVENSVASDEAVIWLLQDVNLGESIQKFSYGVYTLDLNGHTLQGNGSHVLSYGKAGGTLTINDSVGSGKIIGIGCVYAPWTTLTINGGTFEATNTAVASQDATVVINGGTFSGKDAIHPIDCDFTVNNGTFIGTQYAADIYESTFTINDGTFTGGERGLYCLYSGDGTINGGTISGNEYAVYFGGKNCLRVNGGTFISDGYDIAKYHADRGTLVLGLGENGIGATFSGGIELENYTLQASIGEGLGYWQGTIMAVLNGSMTSFTGGDVVIKTACSHNYVDFVCACSAVSPDAEAGVTINGTTAYYASLKEAVGKVLGCRAEDGAVVTLRRDVALSETLDLYTGVFTLDLGGKTLTAQSGDSVVSVSGPANVTVSNGTITGSTSGILLKDGARVTTNATIGGNKYGVNATDGWLTITGGTVSGDSYGVEAQNTNLTVTDGTVGSTNYYGVRLRKSAMRMSGGTVRGGTYGLLANESNVTVTGGTIRGYQALSVGNNSTVTISDGYIRADGTDISVSGNSTITLNVDENGKAIQLDEEIRVSGTTLNNILGEGAAYWVRGKQLTLDDNATSVLATDYSDESYDYIWVKAQCPHTDGTKTYANSDIDHITTYSCCTAYVHEAHSYDGCFCACGAHAPVANGECADCGATLMLIRMGDSEGDGWSDSRINVYEDGVCKATVYVPDGESFTWVDFFDPEKEYEFFWVRGDDAAQCSYEVVLGNEVVATANEENCAELWDGHRIYPECSHADAYYRPTADGHELYCPDCQVKGVQEHSYIRCLCPCGVEQHTVGENQLCAVCGKLPVTINMVSAGGVGWMSNSILIYEDGRLIREVTMDDGEAAIWNGSLIPCKNYEFKWDAGRWAEECSFEIVVGGTVVLAADGEDCAAYEDGQLIYSTLYHLWSDATCTDPKTCSVCGTTEGEALGHSYVDGKCFCGAVLYGIYEDENGDLYYHEDGEPVKNKGLVQVVDEDGHIHYYYFGCGNDACSLGDACAGEYKAQKGIHHYAAITNGYLIECGYDFGEDGVILHIEDTSANGITEIDGVKFCLIDGVKVYKGLFEVDGKLYYARTNGALVVDRTYWISKTNDLLTAGNYTFDASGALIPPEAKNGIYAEDDGLFYYVDGSRSYAGLIEIDGALYYVRSNGQLVTDRAYWITKTNGLKPAASYNFDESGKLCETVKNGLIEENGGLYYYVDGKRSYAGLIEIDGAYYYIRSNGQAVTGRSYWVTKTNDLKPAASYSFDESGKLCETVKNGLIAEDGGLYYYVDGKRSYAGLIEIDGAYYYIRSNGQAVTGRSYWITKTNDLLPAASYSFDADGVMENPPA